jgi:hypothetical protein
LFPQFRPPCLTLRNKPNGSDESVDLDSCQKVRPALKGLPYRH